QPAGRSPALRERCEEARPLLARRSARAHVTAIKTCDVPGPFGPGLRAHWPGSVLSGAPLTKGAPAGGELALAERPLTALPGGGGGQRGAGRPTGGWENSGLYLRRYETGQGA